MCIVSSSRCVPLVIVDLLTFPFQIPALEKAPNHTTTYNASEAPLPTTCTLYSQILQELVIPRDHLFRTTYSKLPIIFGPELSRNIIYSNILMVVMFVPVSGEVPRKPGVLYVLRRGVVQFRGVVKKEI